jgi:hypothetical protein
MLTSLDFLKEGQTFPPASESDRMEMYARNKELFEGEHVKVYKEDLKRIERVIGNWEQVISYPIVLNFQKVMSLKISDLLVGEPPKFTVAEDDKTSAKTLELISKKSDLVNTSYMAGVDVSRYGDGLFLIRQGTDGGIIDITQPSIWYPVVNPDNVKEITQHVLAWTYTVGIGDAKKTYLNCQIHNKGSCETRKHEIISSILSTHKMIGPLVGEPQKISTGLDDFAIVQIPNVMTSDRVTGIDDYTDVDSIVSELMVRVGQVSRILDKHASPSMQGPAGALEQDPSSGEWRFKAGTYIPLEPDDNKAEYLVWNSELTANFKQIEILMNILYTISEMGNALFGDVKGAIPSGSALKRLMISPLAKVNRIRMRFDYALKKAIKLCSQLGGKNISNLTDVDVSIVWQDGLPSDPMEEAQIIDLRTAHASTMSAHTALMRYDGMTKTDAEAEVAAIQDEIEASNPMTTLTGPPEAVSNAIT